MIIVVQDPEQPPISAAILSSIDPQFQIVNYMAQSNDALLAQNPDLFILTHRLAQVQAKTLRAAAEGRDFRTLVLVDNPESSVIFPRFSGADACLRLPLTDMHLRRAIRNECVTVRRRREAAEMIAVKTVFDGRFELKKVLGVGLRSVVFLAADRATKRLVSIKYLRRKLLDQPQIVEAFLRCWEKRKQIHAEALPEVLEIGSFDGLPYIVLDLGEGRNLWQLAAEGRFPEIEAIRAGLAVVRALREMRQAGMLHLNLKPENVIYAEGRYFLTDFGLPIPMTSPRDNTEFAYWSDAAFASPEFFRSEASFTARSDVYSLGALLATLMTRRNPYAGRHVNEVATLHLSRETDFELDEADPPMAPQLRAALETTLFRRASSRSRLVDVEIIFYLLSALHGGKYPMEAPVVRRKTVIPVPECTDNMTTVLREQTAELESETELMAYVPPPPEDPWERVRRRKQQRTKIKVIIAGSCFLLAFLMWFFSRPPKITEFRQGKLEIFTCYSNHTNADRTLNYRTIRCRDCGEPTSQSYDCLACGKTYGLTRWPDREMTEDECKEFEKKLNKCPFCKSTKLKPTPMHPHYGRFLK